MLNNPKRGISYLPYLRIFEPITEDMYRSSTGAIKNSNLWKIRTLHCQEYVANNGNYKAKAQILSSIKKYKISGFQMNGKAKASGS